MASGSKFMSLSGAVILKHVKLTAVRDGASWGSSREPSRLLAAFSRNFSASAGATTRDPKQDDEDYDFRHEEMVGEGGPPRSAMWSKEDSEDLFGGRPIKVEEHAPAGKASHLGTEAAGKGSEMAQGAMDTAKEATEWTKDKAGNLMNAGTDAGKSVVQETTDTVSQVTDVGREAGKSIVRDASAVASKTQDSVKEGVVKSKDTAQQLKEVGEEAAKSVARDASTVGKRVADTGKQTVEWTTETAQQLSEVGQEAVKAAARDLGKVASNVASTVGMGGEGGQQKDGEHK